MNVGKIAAVVATALVISACGDKQDSADRAEEAQKAIEQGMQKERALMEGMQKGVEDIQKKMADESKK